MRESIFQSEWIESWHHHFPGGHVVKIPDMPKSSESRFIPRKPYDCYAIVHGKFFAMELKLMTKIQAFPFNKVPENQVNYLKEVKDNGGNAFLVINYRADKITEKTQARYGLSSSRHNVVYMMDIVTFMELDRSISAKSIPFIDLANLSIVVAYNKLEKEKDKHWDLYPPVYRRLY